MYRFVCLCYQGRKVHGTTAPFGRPWSKNDVVGCLLDCEARTMCEFFDATNLCVNAVISIPVESVLTSVRMCFMQAFL